MPQPPSLRPPPRIESDRGTGISDPVQDPQATQGHRPRPWVVGLIGELIITLAVVVVVLPKMVDPSDEETALGEPTTADDPALRTPPPLIEENATNPILNGLNRSLDEALLQGRSALIARDPEAAAAAFHRASILDPDNAAAKDGLRRTEILTEVRDLEISAMSLESRGERTAAAAAARRILKLDPTSKIAREMVRRLARQAYEDAYHELVSRGLAALEAENYQQALEDFSQASKSSPTAPEVVDGLSRAKAGIHRVKVNSHLMVAVAAEEAEDWSTAVDEYRSVLALEPALADARDGLVRCGRRLDLTRKMDYHLAHPERLATTAVRREAADLTAEAKAISPRGPRFSELIDRLDRLVTQSSIPIPVVLESDGLTKIMLYRVGELGAFDRRTVDLRPGTYTAVGRRPGFRDVRLEFKVDPSKASPTVVIQCKDRI